MSALWRINLLVILFFSLLAVVCMAMLMRQASYDVRRELSAAQVVVDYLREAALRDPGTLESELTRGLRHVRVHWLDGTALPAPQADPLDAWLGAWLYPPAEQLAEPLRLADDRQVLISVDPRDEVDEVWDSLVQLLGLFGLALLLSLLVIRWAVRRGLRVLDELLGGLYQVSQGQLQVRLPAYSLQESQLLAGHFNGMVATLEQVQADNAELTQALLALQEHERKHLALALHDDLGQYLCGIRAQLLLLRSMTAQSQAVALTVRGLEDNCQHLQESFRALIRDLYPVVLERLQLGDAIQLLTEQWQGAQGIRCHLRMSERLPVLSVSHQVHLYRLLQEALTNVARHAQASEVRVRLRVQGSRLSLLVHDNGQGAARLPRPGIGLRSMLERARCLGGELRLRTRPGCGWLLCLSIPLEES
ncbi:sensor histidine kinase [Pseudomonas cavernicola]|uniref:histidine kinase n=1 Tax=Pseudomonas cavernicola TaxID=2320866 RepID=A0A418X858_9PSED|nr:sensor histidine kinase [Pseudomonas cavernicola]RJG08682.1 sensor histidine kinase [Pseudomonas cavernicola]